MNKEKILQVEKPWGDFRQFTHNQLSTVKILTLNPNESFSLQSHENREEFWKIIQGGGWAQIGEEKNKISMGDEFFIPKKVKHRLTAGEEILKVLEISFGDFDEDDIVRYEDKYGRI